MPYTSIEPSLDSSPMSTKSEVNNNTSEQKPFCRKRMVIWMALALLLATLLEGVVFNHFYFRYHLGSYEAEYVPLPFNEQLGTYAQVVTPQNATLVLNNLDLPLLTVGFKVQGNRELVKGQIFLMDDASLEAPVPGNKFKVVAGGEDRDYRVFILSNGNAHALIFSFSDLRQPLALTEVTLNPDPHYVFNFGRYALMCLLFLAIVWLWQSRWYRLRISNIGRRGFWVVQGVSISCCLAVCLSQFILLHPMNVSTNMMFDFNEHGFVFLGNPKQSLLLDFPKNRAELEYHDPYVKTLDALNKGQLNLDVIIDEDMLKAEHPYDPSWRQSHGVEGFWDHSFYNGKYYSYYGYGPVFTLYYPIYLLTGKVPSLTLATFILTLSAICSMYWAFYAVTKFFGVLPQSNALLLGLAEMATVFGCHFFIIQNFLTFYSYAPLLASCYLSLMVATLYTLPTIRSLIKKRIALVFIGLCVVMVVQCRPLDLFWACALCFPFFWRLVWAKNKAQSLAAGDKEQGSQQDNLSVGTYSVREKVFDALAVGIPVVLGAAFTMATNYLRFDSVFEFGQRYCTGIENFLYNKFYFSFDLASSMFYLFFVQGFQQLKDFPFFWLARSYPGDFGNYQYGDFYLGLLGVPVWYGLFLLVVLYMVPKQLRLRGGQEHQPISHIQAASRENVYGLDREWLLKVTLTTLLVILPVICYLQFQVAAFTLRYMMENLVAFAALNVVLLCRYVHFEEGMPLQSKLAYVIALYFLVATVVMEFFAPYSYLEQDFPFVNPDGLVAAKEFFTPLTTVH